MRLQRRIDTATSHQKTQREHNAIETILMDFTRNIHSACDRRCIWYNQIIKHHDDLFDNFFLQLDAFMNEDENCDGCNKSCK